MCNLFLCVCVCEHMCVCLCGFIIRGLHVSMLCVHCTCAGVFYLSVYLRMRSCERSRSTLYCEPRATEGLPEPKPSISGGQIPHMQTNELAHSPPAGARGKKNRVQSMLGEVTGPPYNKMEIRKPSRDARSERTGKYKDKPGIRSSEWVLGKKKNERRGRDRTLKLFSTSEVHSAGDSAAVRSVVIL